jgi:hypothetical protein
MQYSVISSNAERFLAQVAATCPGGRSKTGMDDFARPTHIDKHGRFSHQVPGITITGHISGKHASGKIVLSATPQTPDNCVASITWNATLQTQPKV